MLGSRESMLGNGEGSQHRVESYPMELPLVTLEIRAPYSHFKSAPTSDKK